jgi:alpha-tubulin suppressor-like RCC1 family protein
VQIGGGSTHTCALLADGQVRCWGRGSSGQLGDGTVTSASATVAVRDVNTAIAVSVGGDGRHTCAVYRSGSVQCWGDNEFGQLGNGRTAVTAAPVPVAALTSARSVATYESHSCSVLSDATVQCWGSNEFGQLGNGTVAGGIEPRAVVQLTGVRAVAVGASHSCAVLNSGGVSCWGRNDSGQVGNGSTSQTVLTPTTVSGITTATAVALGSVTSCAVLSSGAVQCWGSGAGGRLGNGANTDSSTPVAVTGITTATAITVGFAHACAALANGTVQCWGNNTSSGQLGNGTNLNSNVPVTVTGISTARAIAANRDATCAVLANGTVQCWGNGTSGQLGNGTSLTSAVPVTVSNVTAATQVAMGDFHACALVTGGTLQCWGRGFEGQIGGSLRASNVAVAVPGISNATAVSAGNQHSCAVLSSGAVQCFGSGEEFRLGNSTVAPAAAPVEAIRSVGSPNTGWWWNSGESGRGFFIERQRDNMFIAGYIYADDGRANWFVASGPMTGNSFTGDMLTARNGQTLLGAYRANAAGPTLGRVVLTFTSDTTATLAWPGGTVSLTRFPFGSGGAGAPENGWWWNADEPGRGFSVEIQGSTLFMVGFMYDDTGNPIWYLSQGPVASGGVTSVWQQVANGQTLTGPYRAPAVVNANAGSMRLTFKSTTSMDLTLPNGRVIALTRFPF